MWKGGPLKGPPQNWTVSQLPPAAGAGVVIVTMISKLDPKSNYHQYNTQNADNAAGEAINDVSRKQELTNTQHSHISQQNVACNGLQTLAIPDLLIDADGLSGLCLGRNGVFIVAVCAT